MSQRANDGPSSFTPVAYLRGAGAPSATWEAIRNAIHALDIATTPDRTTAWHLARGGIPVVLVDFSSDAGALYAVDARYRVRVGPKPVAKLLRKADRDRFAGQAWLDLEVSAEDREPILAIRGERTTFDPSTIDATWTAQRVLELGLLRTAT